MRQGQEKKDREIFLPDPVVMVDKKDHLVKSVEAIIEVLEEEILIVVDLETGGLKAMSRCTRCGKERIVKSSYEKRLEKTTVTYTVTVCPDPKCQKLVEKGLLAEEAKRKIMIDEQEKRAQETALKRKNLKLNK